MYELETQLNRTQTHTIRCIISVAKENACECTKALMWFSVVHLLASSRLSIRSHVTHRWTSHSSTQLRHTYAIAYRQFHWDLFSFRSFDTTYWIVFEVSKWNSRKEKKRNYIHRAHSQAHTQPKWPRIERMEKNRKLDFCRSIFT